MDGFYEDPLCCCEYRRSDGKKLKLTPVKIVTNSHFNKGKINFFS